MCWLITGLAVFFGVHLFTSFRPQRERLIGRVGERTYKAVYALLAFAGFVLIVVGTGRREPVALWSPPSWGHQVALWLMPLAFISVAASAIPSNFRRLTAHPLLWGVSLWAVLHLLANGDLAGLLLFGSFLVYSFYAMWSQTRRGAKPAQTKRPVVNDIAVIAAGLIAYWLFLHFHANLFGVAV